MYINHRSNLYYIIEKKEQLAFKYLSINNY